jgi:ABC-type phosphate/phosphonate transport system substrate-binding protein
VKRLHIISYLAPSVPEEFFRLIADDLDATLEFNDVISGPLPGDEEPFTTGRADVGFVCSPTYRWLRPKVELLPLPLPSDPRAEGRPVYFGDVIVRSGIHSLEELRGGVWAYNDRNSRSGWFSMIERLGETFFSRMVHSGSHLRSIEMVRSGAADAAAIDSNVFRSQKPDDVIVLGSWGPFAIQPTIIPKSAEQSVKSRVANALLTLHERHALSTFGFERFVASDERLYE